MKTDWEGVEFNLKEKYKTTDTYILRGTDEIQALFDEHIMTTQTLQFSAYKKPFEQEIEEWSQTLLLVKNLQHAKTNGACSDEIAIFSFLLPEAFFLHYLSCSFAILSHSNPWI